jgi:hypothetical protein
MIRFQGFVVCMLLLLPLSSPGGEDMDTTNAPTEKASSKLRSDEDGRLDISKFLDEKYGFMPLVVPITEPAVGYGAAGGLMFLSNPIGGSKDGYGRPSITFVGGLGTENGTWGALGADVRYWLDDHLQTTVGFVHMSVNLDYYGIGRSSVLSDNPLRYNLEPSGGILQGKYRLGDSRFWGGLRYVISATEVSFKAPAGTPGLPEYRSQATQGGLTPSFTYDSRDNIFTPTRGTYIEASSGFFSESFGGDAEFQEVNVLAMQFVPISRKVSLGLRGEGSANFGNGPFYMKPYVSLRGAPIMRYQGDEAAEVEAEVRWQCWQRWSLVGFVGGGAAWNQFERFKSSQTLVTGGTGFRYELARKYGIHAGVDVAFGPDNTAVYIQIGSAWARP